MPSDQDSIKKGLPTGRQAFTLVELLITLTISALVLNCAFLLAFGTLSAQKRTAIISKNFQEAAASLKLITKETKAASAISPSSTDTKLVLVSGPDLITYEFLSGKIKRSKNSSGQYITTDGSLYEAVFAYPSHGTVRIEISPVHIKLAITTEAFCRNAI